MPPACRGRRGCRSPFITQHSRLQFDPRAISINAPAAPGAPAVTARRLLGHCQALLPSLLNSRAASPLLHRGLGSVGRKFFWIAGMSKTCDEPG